MKHLLLLHGALGHPDHFAGLRDQLEGRYVIHALTFAGHGDTELPEHGMVMQDHVARIADHCAGLDEKVHIFGYSMGGYAALCYAAAFPQKVAAVMTLATKLEWTEAIACSEAKMLQPELVAQKVPKFAAFLSRLHGEEKWRPLMNAVAASLLDLGRDPLLTEDVLKSITTRTQLMVGDKDNMVSCSETQAAFKLMTNANFAVLPDTAHPFEKVNVRSLAQLMNDFFDQ